MAPIDPLKGTCITADSVPIARDGSPPRPTVSPSAVAASHHLSIPSMGTYDAPSTSHGSSPSPLVHLRSRSPLNLNPFPNPPLPYRLSSSIVSHALELHIRLFFPCHDVLTLVFALTPPLTRSPVKHPLVVACAELGRNGGTFQLALALSRAPCDTRFPRPKEQRYGRVDCHRQLARYDGHAIRPAAGHGQR